MAAVLVLYDPQTTSVPAIEEHVSSFGRFSTHRVSYADGTGRARACDLSAFDAVLLHYSIRICLKRHLSPKYAFALQRYPGLKILFIQDEYDATETARRKIDALGIRLVFTCVPAGEQEKVYPKRRFPSVRFVQTLTGYVPSRLENQPLPGAAGRTCLIGYRGRELAYWYGDLAREKAEIGRRMKQICSQRGVAEDIEWDEASRIYGDAWYEFLRRSRATLGTESGSNIFDDEGEIRASVERALRSNPAATYEEIHRRLLRDHEGMVRMNQISPRVFEAIACGTALVLFEGEYSGVVRPEEHYIPLRKDFSNADEVLAKVQDDAYLERVTRTAHAEVIASGRYSYRAFIARFDDILDACLAGAAERAERGKWSGWLVSERPLTAPEWQARRAAHQGPFLTGLDAGLTIVKRSLMKLLPGKWGAWLRDVREALLHAWDDRSQGRR